MWKRILNRPERRCRPAFNRLCLSAIVLSFSAITQAGCIGVVTAGGGVDFWQHIGNGALQAGKDLNYEVIVRGPKNESDHISQSLIIKQMREKGCNALVLAPNHPQLRDQVNQLAKEGIPTVFIDRNLSIEDVGSISTVSTVQTENTEAGKLAAVEMIKHLKPGQNIAIFRFDPHLSSTTKRERGFIEEISKAQLNIVVDAHLGTDTTDASVNAHTLLTEHPEIHGLFTPNESTTLATLNMRKRLPATHTIIHIGFDTHPEFLESIESGLLKAIVIQTPFQIGYKAVKNALKALNGEQPASRIFTPALVITKENLHSDTIKNVLAGK
jgi:ribose transport system substrate-binding protein